MSAESLIAVHSRPQMRSSQVSWLLLMALFVMLGTAGVVAGPALHVYSAVAEEAQAEERLASLVRLRASLEAARREVDQADSAQLSFALHNMFPSPHPSPSLY